MVDDLRGILLNEKDSFFDLNQAIHAQLDSIDGKSRSSSQKVKSVRPDANLDASLDASLIN